MLTFGFSDPRFIRLRHGVHAAILCRRTGHRILSRVLWSGASIMDQSRLLFHAHSRPRLLSNKRFRMEIVSGSSFLWNPSLNITPATGGPTCRRRITLRKKSKSTTYQITGHGKNSMFI